MKQVMLKNGIEEPVPVVAATMMALETLMDTNPIALYELVQLCKNAKHEIWGENTDALESTGLITIATLSTEAKVPIVGSSIRNVVVSAVHGEGLDMELGSPIKQENLKNLKKQIDK